MPTKPTREGLPPLPLPLHVHEGSDGGEPAIYVVSTRDVEFVARVYGYREADKIARAEALARAANAEPAARAVVEAVRKMLDAIFVAGLTGRWELKDALATYDALTRADATGAQSDRGSR